MAYGRSGKDEELAAAYSESLETGRSVRREQEREENEAQQSRQRDIEQRSSEPNEQC